MRALFLLLVAWATVPASAQNGCALPDEPPFVFGITVFRQQADRTQYFDLNEAGEFRMSYLPQSDTSGRAYIDFSPVDSDSSAAVLRSLYVAARTVICGVRFPSASETVTINYDALRTEVWIKVGDATLGTRLVEPAVSPDAVMLFERLEAVARRSP